MQELYGVSPTAVESPTDRGLPRALDLESGDTAAIELEGLLLARATLVPDDVGFAIVDQPPPGATGAVVLAYDALRSGPVPGVLRIEATDGAVHEVALTGDGVGPAIEVTLPPLVANVPCDAVLEVLLHNPGDDGISVTLFAAGDGPATLRDAPSELVLPAGGTRSLVVDVDGAAPEVGSFSLRLASADPRGNGVAAGPVEVGYVERGTVEATGTAVVELPADADPRSALVEVAGALATDVTVEGSTVTVHAPSVGPDDVVTVTYGILTDCG